MTSAVSTSETPISPVKQSGVSVAKSWAHLVAGASGGAATAVVTSPLDVLRTRLQADFYRGPTTRTRPSQSPSHHVYEAFQLLSSIKSQEGWKGFFRGLGPSLTGVVPATAIKFYTYGNCKQILEQTKLLERDSIWLHISAAATAGIATGTATNPFWLVKTRLQLDKMRVDNAGRSIPRQYKSSWDCMLQVMRNEGIKGLYRGLTASYLGAIETTLHLSLYEQMKMAIKRQQLKVSDSDNVMSSYFGEWFRVTGAAGVSKLLATLIAYPHEVLRTRLRLAPVENGHRKYTGVIQCFRLILREEGAAALYGGLTPHLLRSIPSSIITLGVYESVIGWLQSS